MLAMPGGGGEDGVEVEVSSRKTVQSCAPSRRSQVCTVGYREGGDEGEKGGAIPGYETDVLG